MPRKPGGKAPLNNPPRPLPGAPASGKPDLHPRNRLRGRYAFSELLASSPSLMPFVLRNAYGDDSIDFADAAAVRALNAALLKRHYGIVDWAIPPQYLCPPIPGRADYLHYLADLLAESNGGIVPCGEAIRVLDVGVGANCVYPLIGHGEYGWSFVGSDIDRVALAAAQATVDANGGYRNAIELRFQASRLAIFAGLVQTTELFDLVMCNPPFHASLDEARAGTERKWQNLGRHAADGRAPVLNFGGQSAELCCAGGESGFVGRMLVESVRSAGNCLWFSALVSKASNLTAVYRALNAAGVHESRTIEMTQGQKKSRIVAWTFFNERQRQAWRNQRRGESTWP